MNQVPDSLLAFQRMFPDDDACAAWLIEMRWPDGFVCPACGHDKGWALRGKAAPTSFEVIMIRDLAGRFSGRRTFVEDLEDLIPEFYDRIGQNLRPWAPPPPSIDKRDPIQDTDIVEASEEPNAGGVSQSEADQPHDPQDSSDADLPPAED